MDVEAELTEKERTTDRRAARSTGLARPFALIFGVAYFALALVEVISQGTLKAVIEYTDWASDILRRSFEAARRFNPDAGVRLFRTEGGVEFTLTDEPADGDRTVQGDGFELIVEAGIEGIVDVVEPHDRLI